MNLLSFNLGLNVLGVIMPDKNVAIYNGPVEVLTGNMVFSSSILSCNVIDDSKFCEHPIESGVTITDHKVFNPIEIDIRLSLPNYLYSAVYKELKEIYKKSPKLRIKTQTDWYSNMVLQGLPHEEKPENYDRIIFDLHFKEALIVDPKFIKLPATQLKNPENSDTQKLGENVSNATNKKTSILKQGFNSLGGLLQ